MTQVVLSQERKEEIIWYIGHRSTGRDLIDIFGVLLKREISFQALRAELDVMASKGFLQTRERLIKEERRLATFYSLAGDGLKIFHRIQKMRGEKKVQNLGRSGP